MILNFPLGLWCHYSQEYGSGPVCLIAEIDQGLEL